MALGSAYRASDGTTVFVRAGPDGMLRGVTRVPHAVADLHAAAVPDETAIVASEGEKLRVQSLSWSLSGGVLTATTPPAPSIEAVRSAANARIDQRAEACRALWLTPGAGQAMEYMATGDEAVLANAAPDPLLAADWPWLEAERLALVAGGGTHTLREVVAMVLAIGAGWKAVGASIKEKRRTAKVLIAAAATASAVDAIADGIVWPAP